MAAANCIKILLSAQREVRTVWGFILNLHMRGLSEEPCVGETRSVTPQPSAPPPEDVTSVVCAQVLLLPVGGREVSGFWL